MQTIPAGLLMSPARMPAANRLRQGTAWTSFPPHDRHHIPPATIRATPTSTPPPGNASSRRSSKRCRKSTRLARAFHHRLRGDTLDDAVSETAAFTWTAFLKLAAQGRDPVPLTGSIVDFAARRVRAGRRFAGKVPVQDALSADARKRHDYFVTALPHGDDDEVAAEIRDALGQGSVSPADEAICRADYQAWLQSLSATQKAVAEGLASGLNLTDVAQERGVSKASVQQVRNRLAERWDAFHAQANGR